MKKIYIKLLSGIIAIIALAGCSDFLEVVPDDSPTVDIVFETRTSAETFLATCYSYLPYHSTSSVPDFLAGDELWLNDLLDSRYPNQSFQVAKGLSSPNNSLNDIWRSMYTGIRDCNTFMEHIHAPYDMTETEKKEWTAQVKVLKAYYHFLLMRQYGPIVIVRENLPVGSDIEVAKKRREPVDEVVSYCVKLIDEALPDLPSNLIGSSVLAQKVTVVAALSLKAKILVTAASPLFNGNEYYAGFKDEDGRDLINTNYDSEKWVLAKEACKAAVERTEEERHELYTYHEDVINSQVLSDMTKLKYSIIGSVTEDIASTEKIWETRGSVNQAHYMAKMSDPLAIISDFMLTAVAQIYSPPMRMAELFYSENGVPIDQDRTYPYEERFNLTVTGTEEVDHIPYGYQTAVLHTKREPRFYANLGFDGARYLGYGRFSESAPYIAEMRAGRSTGYKGGDNHEYSATGYLVRKLIHVKSELRTSGVNFYTVDYNHPVIRLADLYLMYAETINEVDGPTAECYEYIDKVRERAGLDGLLAAWDAYAFEPQKVRNKDGLREAIQHERMIELAFEGHRFWDLRRWKRAKSMMDNQPIMAWNVQSGVVENYYTRKKIAQQVFEEKDYLYPIPLTVILANDNLKQNPGW